MSPQGDEGIPTSRVDDLVLETNDFDVLFGRGKANNERKGNLYFRQRIIAHAPEYTSAVRVQNKDKITKQLIAEIHGRGGRFLRVEKKETTRKGKWPLVPHGWSIATPAEVERKVKQAFRDAHAAQKRSDMLYKDLEIDGRFACLQMCLNCSEISFV